MTLQAVQQACLFASALSCLQLPRDSKDKNTLTVQLIQDACKDSIL